MGYFYLYPLLSHFTLQFSKFTVQALEKLGFAPENIVTTLEKRMKCGIGICGRCNIGGRFVCVDGPVFTWAELKELPPDM